MVILETADKEVERDIVQMGLTDFVELPGPYTQAEAPALYHRAHILLHTKYNGLPARPSFWKRWPADCRWFIQPPEAFRNWSDPIVGELESPPLIPGKKTFPPDPESLAEAVASVWANRVFIRNRPDAGPKKKFGAEHWIQQHKTVFQSILKS